MKKKRNSPINITLLLFSNLIGSTGSLQFLIDERFVFFERKTSGPLHLETCLLVSESEEVVYRSI